MNALTITPKGPLRGVLTLPGDKSITHRALILSALADGQSIISGHSKGEDCLNTLRCLQALGIPIEEQAHALTVSGKGLWGMTEPSAPLDCGNSGTGFRLLSGVLAGQDFFSVLTGDDSLRTRPMGRIVTPLRLMGAHIYGRKGGELAPLAITGGRLRGIHFVSPVSSAQVKSAVLLAGLLAEETTSFTEPRLSRDHTERMFQFLNIPFEQEGLTTRLRGGVSFSGKAFTVPGDMSAAAFFLVAASIVPHSEVLIQNVGLNPARTGILEILESMGADIQIINLREEAGEPIADLRVRSSTLHGISIGPDQVPKTIDELPILCVAAALAKGKTTITGAKELRVKETDRIHAMTTELKKLQVAIEETPDGFIIDGPAQIRGNSCSSYGDHRVAMSVAIAALTADSPTTISDTACIETSFPGFHANLLELLTNS